MNLPDHGANPHLLYEKAGMEQPKRILDFSENVHPFGPPAFIEESWAEMRGLIGRYPDPDAEPFRSAAANFHSVSAEQIAAANGAAEVFTWLARRYRGKRVVLIEPAFSEYRKSLEAEQVEIKAVQLTAESGWHLPIDEIARAVAGCAALYICNPHNPTGVKARVEDLLQLAQRCREVGCELVVDEAFIDFIGEQASIIPHLPEFPNLIVVRSMTKMYAIPGLRLGYVIAEAPLLSELTKGAAHWNVNALSANIGACCFSEFEYRDNVIRAANRERQQMTEFLVEHGCLVTNAAANFLTFQLPHPEQSEAFFTAMLKAGIVLRHTKSFCGMDGQWFRIGMKSEEQMKELRKEMANWLKGH
ncbi:pyridoxal phosphate-dependent aminotransferase [Planococcus sp. YIM B11945]|uniref:pyridoxal phosphate-dependent aminotransferase n=1 Tax=Planococcus sp. YIM B11945 TaxID=3435410 RepID=UPI003D7DBBC1